MGRQAAKKLKRRQRDQRHWRAANARERQLIEEVNQGVSGAAERLAEAPLADVKAAGANMAEWLDTVAAHPEATEQTAEYMRNVFRMRGRVRNENLDRTCPKFTRAFHEAIDRLVTTVSPICQHLAESIAPAFQCAAHPDLGVLCYPCITEHNATHSEADEFRCDECGRVNIGHIYPIASNPLTGIAVRHPDYSEPRLFPGPVTINGYGICNRCYRKR
jgi:hypothetical protein